MGTLKSSTRQGAEARSCDSVHRIPISGAGPGSLWSTLEWALGRACVPSSQAFRQDSLVPSESWWWSASVPIWTSNSAGAWVVAATDLFTALECGSTVSSKQAFATEEAKANNHTSSSTNAVLRLVRAQMLRVRTLPFVEAARAAGVPPLRVWLRHALPHALQPLRTALPLSVAGLLGLESTLSFLGIGLPPDVASWGRLMATIRNEPSAWWTFVMPGSCLIVSILSLNSLSRFRTVRAN